VEAPPPRDFDFEGLEIETQVCQGRNSEVWQGTMGNVNVAIKMFASNHRQLFLNTSPGLVSPGIAFSLLMLTMPG
jgi:hypothetical protein